MLAFQKLRLDGYLRRSNRLCENPLFTILSMEASRKGGLIYKMKGDRFFELFVIKQGSDLSTQ